VVINEDMVKMKAFQLGLTKGKKDLTQSAKATATVALLTEKLSTSIDDAKNTAGSFTNRVRGLWAAIRDLGREYGDQIIKGAGLAELFGTIADKVRNLTARIMESRVIEKWAARFRTEIDALVQWLDDFMQGGLLRQQALETMGQKIGAVLAKAGDMLVDQVILRAPEIGAAIGRAGKEITAGVIAGGMEERRVASLPENVKLQMKQLSGRAQAAAEARQIFAQTGQIPGSSKKTPVYVADAGGPDSVVGVSSK